MAGVVAVDRGRTRTRERVVCGQLMHTGVARPGEPVRTRQGVASTRTLACRSHSGYPVVSLTMRRAREFRGDCRGEPSALGIGGGSVLASVLAVEGELPVIVNGGRVPVDHDPVASLRRCAGGRAPASTEVMIRTRMDPCTGRRTGDGPGHRADRVWRCGPGVR